MRRIVRGLSLKSADFTQSRPLARWRCSSHSAQLFLFVPPTPTGGFKEEKHGKVLPNKRAPALLTLARERDWVINLPNLLLEEYHGIKVKVIMSIGVRG